MASTGTDAVAPGPVAVCGSKATQGPYCPEPPSYGVSEVLKGVRVLVQENHVTGEETLPEPGRADALPPGAPAPGARAPPFGTAGATRAEP